MTMRVVMACSHLHSVYSPVRRYVNALQINKYKSQIRWEDPKVVCTLIPFYILQEIVSVRLNYVPFDVFGALAALSARP